MLYIYINKHIFVLIRYDNDNGTIMSGYQKESEVFHIL